MEWGFTGGIDTKVSSHYGAFDKVRQRFCTCCVLNGDKRPMETDYSVTLLTTGTT